MLGAEHTAWPQQNDKAVRSAPPICSTAGNPWLATNAKFQQQVTVIFVTFYAYAVVHAVLYSSISV